MIVRATAPVRVADVGGWTDTWFGSPGQVCSVAVGPGVTVEVEEVDGEHVRLLAPDLGVDRLLGPEVGEQPLIEHAIASILGDRRPGLEVRIRSAVAPGASLGTSAAVLVALLGALDVVVDANRPPEAIAVEAHRVETELAGREAGVQDQWAAALGGCALLTIPTYPQVRHRRLDVADEVLAALAERTVTMVFGSHDSSAVHAQVINDVVGCSGADHERARVALRSLGRLAGEAADRLEAGDLDGWGAVLADATEAQASLHPELVGAPHRAAIESARSLGAVGWKVNGAGGSGGSLTVVLPAGVAPDPRWPVADLQPAAGLAVSARGRRLRSPGRRS